MAVSITITNIMGTPLLEFRRLYLSPGKNRFNLARFHLPPGIYILLLDGDNIHIAQRFIIGSWWRAPAQ